MTIVNIKEISEVEGRNGLQWQLRVQWPWTIGTNVDSVWLDQQQFQKPKLGSQTAVVARRGVKKNKEQVAYDGHLDWMWSWSILEFGVDGPLPPATAQAPQQAPRPSSDPTTTAGEAPESPPEPDYGVPAAKDDVQARIERGMAFNGAYTLMAATLAGETEEGATFLLQGPDTLTEIRRLRDRLYHEVIQVPVAPLGYCYRCEANTLQGKTGSYGHQTPDGWCIDEVLRPEEATSTTQDPLEGMPADTTRH